MDQHYHSDGQLHSTSERAPFCHECVAGVTDSGGSPMSDFAPITRADLDDCTRFHAGDCTISYGKTGKARPTVKSEEWRANGRLRTWKRDAGRYELPIKHGLRDYSVIDAAQVESRYPCTMHRADTCPVMAEAAAWWDAHR